MQGTIQVIYLLLSIYPKNLTLSTLPRHFRILVEAFAFRSIFSIAFIYGPSLFLFFRAPFFCRPTLFFFFRLFPQIIFSNEQGQCSLWIEAFAQIFSSLSNPPYLFIFFFLVIGHASSNLLLWCQTFLITNSSSYQALCNYFCGWSSLPEGYLLSTHSEGKQSFLNHIVCLQVQ